MKTGARVSIRQTRHFVVTALLGFLILAIAIPFPNLSSRAVSAATKPFPSVAFVVGCAESHTSNDDPIVHPGHAGMSHRHVFFGNSSTNATSTLALLSEAKTTCEEPADKASYWLPALDSGRWINMRAYYVAGDVKPRAVKPFPAGLQVVAGGSFDKAGSQPSVMWSCGLLLEQSGWTQARPTACRVETKATVRIDFPQCWDGTTLPAPGNMVNASKGSCPDAFPVAVPMLRITAEINGNPKRIASGGFETMHADFWNAWDSKRLDQLVATCIRGERLTQQEVRRCGVPGGGPRRG